jgi:hypothetical protein
MSLLHSFESGEHKQKKSHFENLIAIAQIDGKVDDKEYDFLIDLAERFSLTEEEVKHMLEKPQHYSFNPPAGKEERQEQLKDLFKIILIDTIINDNEIALCKKFAIALHYAPSIVVRIGNLLESNKEKDYNLYDIISKLEDIIE